MFLRFSWRLSGWDGALSRNSKTFQFSTSSLWSKAVRTWIMISVVIHAFLLRNYCIPYGLEGLGNFRKYRGTLLFPITAGSHALNPREDPKNATVSRSFDFLPPLHFFLHVPDVISRIALNIFWKSLQPSLDGSYRYIPCFSNYSCLS